MRETNNIPKNKHSKLRTSMACLGLAVSATQLAACGSPELKITNAAPEKDPNKIELCQTPGQVWDEVTTDPLAPGYEPDRDPGSLLDREGQYNRWLDAKVRHKDTAEQSELFRKYGDFLGYHLGDIVCRDELSDKLYITEQGRALAADVGYFEDHGGL